MNTFKEHLVENRVDKRRAAVDKTRRYVEGIASDIAVRHDNFEEFAAHIHKLIPRLEWKAGGTASVDHETGPIFMDVKHMWESNNPRKREEFKRSWDSYGEARARGEHASKDGWTGD